MLIKLQPQARFDSLTVAVQGDVLIRNGDPLDFSPLEDGAVLPAKAIGSIWIAEEVKRVDGAIHVTGMLPHAEDASEAARFPQPISVVADGPVELPK